MTSDRKFKVEDRIVLNALCPLFTDGTQSVANVTKGDTGTVRGYAYGGNAVIEWDIHPKATFYVDENLISLNRKENIRYKINTKDHSATFDTLDEAKETAKFLKKWGITYVVTKNVISSEEIDI